MKILRNYKMWTSALLIGGAVSSLQAASPTLYDYHPDSTFALGRGFEPNTLIEPKLNCLDFEEKADLSNGVATSTSLTMEVVHSAEDVKKTFGVDFGVDARYMQAKFNTAFNLNTESQFNSDSVNILLAAQSEYGTTSMDNAVLKGFARDWIKNGHHDVFRKECGSHLVASIVKGVKIGILLTFSNINNKTMDSLKNETGFKYGSGDTSVKLKLKLNDVMNRARETGTMQIRVFATGSQGVQDLHEIVAKMTGKKEDLDGLLTALSEYLKKFTAATSVPIRFSTKPFGFGYEDKYENLWRSHYETKIQKIASIYRSLSHQVGIAKSIYKGEDLRSLMLSPEEKRSLILQTRATENYLDDLVELHRNCQYNVYDALDPSKPNTGSGGAKDHCQYDEDTIPSFTLPELPTLPATSGNRKVLDELKVSGVGVKEVLLIYANEDGPRVLRKFSYDMPTVLEKRSHAIPLESFWNLRKSHVAGTLRGSLIITDYFGRRTQSIFYITAHSATGSPEPFLEKFEPSGFDILL